MEVASKGVFQEVSMKEFHARDVPIAPERAHLPWLVRRVCVPGCQRLHVSVHGPQAFSEAARSNFVQDAARSPPSA